MAAPTGPLSSRERAEIAEELRRRYRESGRRGPGRVVWARSPEGYRPYRSRWRRFESRSATGRLRERALRLLSPVVGLTMWLTVGALGWTALTVLAGHERSLGTLGEAVFLGPDRWGLFSAWLGMVFVFWSISEARDMGFWKDDRIALREPERSRGSTGNPWYGCYRLLPPPELDDMERPAPSGAGCLRLGGPGRAFACATFRGLAVVVEPPTVMRTEPLPDGGSRPHCDDGPALEWPGGERYFFLHGVLVPDDLFHGRWDVHRIGGERNSELRRLAIERMGWENYLAAAGLVPVAETPDPANPGAVLRLFDVPDANARVLLMRNGSPDRSGALRHYAEPVPRTLDDPVEAAAWQYDCPPEVYRRLQRRT